MTSQPKASPEDIARAEKVAGPHDDGCGFPSDLEPVPVSKLLHVESEFRAERGPCDCSRRERVLAIAAEFEKVRAEAHKQAAEDVCMYCGGRARQYNRTAIGPNKAGNWTHLHLSGNPEEEERCIASSIWARRHFGRESPHAELLPPLRASATEKAGEGEEDSRLNDPEFMEWLSRNNPDKAEALKLRAAIRDIDAHATPAFKDSSDLGAYYIVTVGSLHRALALTGAAAKCRDLPCERAATASADRDALREENERLKSDKHRQGFARDRLRTAVQRQKERADALVKALEWVVNLCYGIGKSGEPPTSEEYIAGLDEARALLARERERKG